MEERRGEPEQPPLSGLRAPAPFGGWWHFPSLTDDKNHTGLVSNPGSNSDPKNQFTQGGAQESVYLGDRFFTSDKAGKHTYTHTELGEEGRAKITNQEAILDYPDS